MKKVSTLLALVLLLAMSVNVCAQDEEEEYFEKDFLEVALFMGGTLPVGGIADWSPSSPRGDIDLGAKLGFNAGFEVGYFLTADLVLGGNFTYHQMAIDSDVEEVSSSKHRIYSPKLYMKYYFFSESNFVPYLKVLAGIDIIKFTTPVIADAVTDAIKYRELSYDPVFSAGIGAGLFYYTNDYGGLYLEANVHNGFSSNLENDYPNGPYEFGESTTIIDVHAGIKVFFGS